MRETYIEPDKRKTNEQFLLKQVVIQPSLMKTAASFLYLDSISITKED